MSEYDDCDEMVIVALLVSLNHDDGGEADDDYDFSCRAFKAQNKCITVLAHLPPQQVEDEADLDRVRHLDGELEPRDEFGRP